MQCLSHPKHIGSHDLSHVRARDVSGDLFLVWSHGTRSCDDLAHVPCFLESCGGLITGFPCGTFDLELWELNVVDCIYDRYIDILIHYSMLQWLSKQINLIDVLCLPILSFQMVGILNLSIPTILLIKSIWSKALIDSIPHMLLSVKEHKFVTL